jgi:hypothetical protein
VITPVSPRYNMRESTHTSFDRSFRCAWFRRPNDLLKFQCLAVLGLLIIAVLLTIKWFRAL